MKLGLDDLLFNLLVLGGLQNKHGEVWKCRPQDLYIIEITDRNLVYVQKRVSFTSKHFELMKLLIGKHCCTDVFVCAVC